MASTNVQSPFAGQEYNWADPKSVRGIADKVSLTNSNEFYRKHSVAAGSISRVPTYHKDQNAQYVLPNDFPEHIALAAQAVHLSHLVNEQVFHAPLDTSKVTATLDVGCGTGIVTDLMAERFPSAQCYGLDLSPVPDIHTHLPSVHFVQGNVISQKPSQWKEGASNKGPFSHDKGLFDYIFSRMQILGMYNWPAFIKTEFSLLKSGGWAEVHDIDWEYLEGQGKNISDDWEWSQIMEKDWKVKGMDMFCGSKAKNWMAEAGSREIQTFVYEWPFNADAGSSKEKIEFADFTETMMPEMMHHSIERTMEGKASQEQIERMQADMRRDNALAPGKHKLYTVTIGRKP